MMTTKEVTIAPPEKNLECCMCGDYGLSDELYNCKICQFRSQHRYCSNLYPKAESYRVCNWCLDQTDRQNSTEKGSKSSSNSSSLKIEDLDMDDDNDNNNNNNNNDDISIGRRLRSSCGQKQKPSLVHLKIKNAAMRDQRQKSLDNDHQRSPTVRKRIITKGALEDRLRRTKSEEMSSTASAAANNVGITRNVFRNKVRRYKLLDEVSS